MAERNPTTRAAQEGDSPHRLPAEVAFRRDDDAVDPLDRMREAAFDARERLDGVTWHMDLDTFYAPLSETLIWVTALADAMGFLQQPVFSGIAYARNCTLHGSSVVAAVYQQPPMGVSPLKGDNRRLAVHGALVWGFTADPEPHDPASGTREQNAQRRRDYNAEVSGHAVFPMVDALLLDVGVNIWGRGAKPQPKPAPRRKVIPPGSGPPGR